MSSTSDSEEVYHDVDWETNEHVFDYTDPASLSSQHFAVINNDVATLDELLSSSRSVNVHDNQGNTLLHHAVKTSKSEDVFKLLIQKDDLRLDVQNFNGKTPLHVAINEGEYLYAKSLIELGADVNLADFERNYPLHYAIRRLCPKITLLLLENGADMESRNIEDKTALYSITEFEVANRESQTEIICMLLCFGANPTAYNFTLGNSPFGNVVGQQDPFLEEIFFNYIFSSERKTCTTDSLLCAFNSSYCFELFSSSEWTVSCNNCVVSDLAKQLKNLSPKRLVIFLKKYTKISEKIFMYCSSVHTYNNYNNYMGYLINYKTFLSHRQNESDICNLVNTFYEVGIGSKLLQYRKRVTKDDSLIKYLIYFNVNLEFLTKLVCLLASHGVPFYFTDLLVLYQSYGYCELFEFMININILKSDLTESLYSVMPILIYEVSLSIDDLWGDKSCLLKIEDNMKDLFYYFALPKLKAYCLQTCRESTIVTQNIKRLPDVPALLELSRNASRKFIIKSKNINHSSDFQACLNLLNIPKICKDILTLKKRIYDV